MEKIVTQELKERMSNITQGLTNILTDIQKKELQNTQEALNFIDNINKLSVSF